MSFFETILTVLFPDKCVGCSVRGGLLCVSCRRELPPAPSPKEPFIASAYAYQDLQVKRLVKLLKYKNTRHAAALFGAPLAGMLIEFIGEETLFLGSRSILIVPVPLSKGRRKVRGYNQAELIAKAMLKELGGSDARVILETSLLEKHIETKSQADIGKRSARLSNLGDCFRVRAGRVPKGEIVILIDDVTTTGATLTACRKALLEKGFTRIFALTVAH